MHELLLGEGEDLFAGEADGNAQKPEGNNDRQAVVAE